MSTIVSIDYDELNTAYKEAKKAASECDDYVQGIKRKVTQKLSSLTLGGNSYTAQANYLAQRKISNLNEKKSKYTNFANQVDSANQYARETDEKVSNYIKKESKDFRKTHDMKVGVLEEFFTWVTTSLLNETAFGRLLNQLARDIGTWLDSARRKFKEWYELKGGKYIIKTIIAVVGAVVAVIALIFVAWPALLAILGEIAAAGLAGLTGALIWALITATAGVVTAVVAVLNGVTKSIAGIASIVSFKDDPGWAKRYGGFSSFAEYMRENYFNCPFMDSISGAIANAVDVADTIASIINVADIIKHGINVFQHIREVGIHKVFDRVRFSNNGKMTWGTFKYGLKKLIGNAKTMTSLASNTPYARLQAFCESESKLKSLFSFYKTLKSGKKFMSTVDTIFEKGALSTILETIKKKFQDLSVMHKYGKDVKDVIDKIKDTGKNISYGY